MTQTPSIKEALKPCPFCGGKPELLNGGPGNWFVRCTDCKCTTNDVQRDRAVELWNTRATLQPDGERREAIKALAHRFWSIHPSEIAAKNLTREEFYEREMTKLLASGLVQDEAGIRRDEREKCAEIADLRYEPVATEIAASIRSARDGGAS